jgi:cadmium resistance protein CadD (predicted permease)
MANQNTRANGGDVETGMILIVTGVALLLHQTGALPLSEMVRLWPLVPIAVGLKMLIAPAGAEGERS